MQILEMLVLASDLINVFKELSNFIPLDLDKPPFIFIFGFSYPSKSPKKTAI